MMLVPRTSSGSRVATTQLIGSALQLTAEPQPQARSTPIDRIGDLSLILTEPLEDSIGEDLSSADQPVWTELLHRVESEDSYRRTLEVILVARQAALLEALALETSRRSIQRARHDGLRSFAETRYGKAEGLYWQVLESSPGEASARVFLAEALIAQRLWVEAQDVLLGLMATRGQQQGAITYAQALLHGFKVGLYQRLGSFP